MMREVDRGDRGLPLLRARRAGPEGHAARLHHQPGQLRRGAGRVLDHPADGEADADSRRTPRSSARPPPEDSYERKSASCATPSPSSRSTPSSGSSSATSTSPTSATAPGASRRPRATTSQAGGQAHAREAALLAGIVQEPERVRPDQQPRRGRASGATSCSAGWPSSTSSPRSEADRSRRKPLGLDVTASQNGCVGVSGACFCDYVHEYLLADESLGRTRDQRERLLNSGGLTIHTTLDPRFQRGGRQRGQGHVYPTDQAIGGLAMVVPGRGEVRALSQSRPMGATRARGRPSSTTSSRVSTATPGASRPARRSRSFVLAAAISQGIPLSTQITAPPRCTSRGRRLHDCDGTTRPRDVWESTNSTGSRHASTSTRAPRSR